MAQQSSSLPTSTSQAVLDMATAVLLDNVVALCENQINDTVELQSCNGSSLIDVGAQMAAAELPFLLRCTSTIICAFVLLLGITGNLLVPFVVFRTKDLRNSTNLFLINLSIADLLVLIVCMPTVLIELHTNPETWLLGELMCKLVPFVETAVAHASILTILAISFERYYAICKPLKAGYKCTKFRALVIIVCVWTLATLTTIPNVFISELRLSELIEPGGAGNATMVPVCISQPDTTWKKLYFLATMGAFFWTPLLILLVVYFIITKRLCLDDIGSLSAGSGGTSLVQHSEHMQMRARRQVVFMLAAVVACFFICLLPFRIFTVWLIFSTEQQIQDFGMEAYYTTLYACRIMLYLNSAINPILYNLISSKFRAAFTVVLCCKPGDSRSLFRQSTFTTSSLTLSSIKNSLHRNAPFLRQESKASQGREMSTPKEILAFQSTALIQVPALPLPSTAAADEPLPKVLPPPTAERHVPSQQQTQREPPPSADLACRQPGQVAVEGHEQQRSSCERILPPAAAARQSQPGNGAGGGSEQRAISSRHRESYV